MQYKILQNLSFRWYHYRNIYYYQDAAGAPVLYMGYKGADTKWQSLVFMKELFLKFY